MPDPAKIGRPTDYKPEYAEQAAKLCALGATDEELADFFGVCARTIYRWSHRFPEFSQSLKQAKEEADERVVRSLYNRAVGYTFDSEKIFLPKDSTTPVRVPTKEHVSPDVTAGIFWLKNRRSGEWRDKQEHAVSGSINIGQEYEGV